MALFLTTFVTALLLIELGRQLFWKSSTLEVRAKGMLRSKKAAFMLFGAASLWFLGHISQLGMADFGQYKKLLLLFFAGISLGSFLFVQDFLAVRGASVLLLLASHVLLTIAYMQEPIGRLALVFFAYSMITAGLYFGALPYKLRDCYQWLFAEDKRTKLVGSIIGAYGVFLAAIAFTY